MLYSEIIDEAAAQFLSKVVLAPKGIERGRELLGGKYRSYAFGLIVNGEDRGYIYLKFRNGDDSIAEVNVWGDGANKFGPTLVRQMLMLIRKRFPRLKELYGKRISGARQNQRYAVQRVRLPPPSTISDHSMTH